MIERRFAGNAIPFVSFGIPAYLCAFGLRQPGGKPPLYLTITAACRPHLP